MTFEEANQIARARFLWKARPRVEVTEEQWLEAQKAFDIHGIRSICETCKHGLNHDSTCILCQTCQTAIRFGHCNFYEEVKRHLKINEIIGTTCVK